MNLTFEQIKSITFGAIDIINKEDGNVRKSRLMHSTNLSGYECLINLEKSK